MALIKPEKVIEKIKMNFTVNSELKNEIERYCEWAKVSIEDFFSQAAEFIFKKDKDWNSLNEKPKKK